MTARRRRKLLMISDVAERYGVHPQTLRLYEREGLLKPKRSPGNTRLFDEDSLVQLESILFLTRELGVNLAGVEVIMSLREQMAEMQEEIDRLMRTVRDQVHERRSRTRREFALVRIEAGPLVPADKE